MARTIYTQQLATYTGMLPVGGVVLLGPPAVGTVVSVRAYIMQMTPSTPLGYGGPALRWAQPAVQLGSGGPLIPLGEWQPSRVDPQAVAWDGQIQIEAPNLLVLAQFGGAPAVPLAVTCTVSGWILVPSS